MSDLTDLTFPAVLSSTSADETEAIGATLAKQMEANGSLPPFVALYGDLGVGKTAFVRGFCSELCKGYTVKSPTFALVNEYRSAAATGGIKRVYHFRGFGSVHSPRAYALCQDAWLLGPKGRRELC